MQTLAERYRGIRRARNDGNCFFRGFAFSLLEYLVERRVAGEVEEVIAALGQAEAKLERAGFQKICFEVRSLEPAAPPSAHRGGGGRLGARRGVGAQGTGT